MSTIDRPTSGETREARLDAVAATRMLLSGAGDDGCRAYLAGSSADPLEVAHAAIGLAASLLAMYPADAQSRILDGLTAAATEAG